METWNCVADDDRVLREEIEINDPPELPPDLEVIEPDKDELKEIR